MDVAVGAKARSQTKPRVLVVEDNYLTAVAVCNIVRDSGFEVTGPVSKLESGLHLIDEQSVEAAIVDINLNGRNSYALCRALRSRKVPFAFLTGYPASSVAASFRAAPFLAKPVDPRRLRTVLEMLAGDAAAPNASAAPEGNLVIQGLADEDQRLIQPCLESASWQLGDVLQVAGEAETHVHFPVSGMVSLTIGDEPDQIETALVGREGLIGMGTVMGVPRALHHAIAHHPGKGWRVEGRELLLRFAESPRLRARCLSYGHDLMGQISVALQLAGHATVEERLACWLLTATDRLAGRDIFTTHDRIARAMGVRRAGVTVALHVLEGKRAIRSERGRILILNRDKLVELAGPFQPRSHA